jgi:hypothetical protein
MAQHHRTRNREESGEESGDTIHKTWPRPPDASTRDPLRHASQGLKPDFVRGFDIQAEARIYLRDKGNNAETTATPSRQ